MTNRPNVEGDTALTWFPLSDEFYSDPQFLGASDAAVALYVRAASWSARHLTDGRVPSTALPLLTSATEQAPAELTERGVWKRARGGFQFTHWPTGASQAAVTARRDADRTRQQRKRSSDHTVSRRDTAVTHARSHGPVTATSQRPRPSPKKGSVGGESPETYENDHHPPAPTTDPDNPRCTEHAHIPATERGPNCPRCRDTRLLTEQHQHHTDQQQRMATRRCPHCDTDGWRWDEHHVPLTPYQRCNHRPLRSVS